MFLWIVGLLESMFIYCICTQYLVGAPFALITASIRRGMEVISLWHCWGGMKDQVSLTVVFSSSAFFGLLFLIFLLTIPHRFSMFRSGEFAGQSRTPTPWSFNQLLVLLAVWAGAKSTSIHPSIHLICDHKTSQKGSAFFRIEINTSESWINCFPLMCGLLW